MASDASIPVWTPQILSSNLKKKKKETQINSYLIKSSEQLCLNLQREGWTIDLMYVCT